MRLPCSFLCPNHEEQHFIGVCQNGNITVQTSYGNLTGVVTEHDGRASGTVKIMPGMSAEVSLEFQRG